MSRSGRSEPSSTTRWSTSRHPLRREDPLLFDHGTPAVLRGHLREHSVNRSAERGWERTESGEPIRSAKAKGYEVIVTTDQYMRHQQNLAGRELGVVVLMATAWPRVRHRVDEIRAAIAEVRPGQVKEVSIPRRVPDG